MIKKTGSIRNGNRTRLKKDLVNDKGAQYGIKIDLPIE